MISADSPLYQRRLLSVSIVFAQDHVEQVGMDNGRQEMLSYCDRTRQRRDHTWLFTVLNLAFDYVTHTAVLHVCHTLSLKSHKSNVAIADDNRTTRKVNKGDTLYYIIQDSLILDRD